MRNNSLDDIIRHTIDISNPPSNDATFDSILLVLAAPSEEGEKTISETMLISKADELLDFGYTSESEAYKAATVAFSQNPSPKEIFVCVRQSEDPEATPVVYESITDTLARAASEANFYGVHITEFKDEADVEAAKAWTEANGKVYGFEYDDYDNCPVKNFSYYRTFGMYSGDADGYKAEEQPAENAYAALAAMAKCFGYTPGSETWDLKELATIVPSKLSADQKKKLKDSNINMFLRYSGTNCLIGGYMLAGEWIDVIRFMDWLDAEIQFRVFSVMKANKKVPFTDKGIGLIEGAIISALKQGQTNGGIAETEYDADGNPIPGFTVTVPKASSLTEAERKARKLPYCKWTARLAGAIHAVEIEGNLTF